MVCMHECMYTRAHALSTRNTTVTLQQPSRPISVSPLSNSLHLHNTRTKPNLQTYCTRYAVLHAAPTTTIVTLRTNFNKLKIRVSWRPWICSFEVTAGKFTPGTAKWTGLSNGIFRSTVEGKYRIKRQKLLHEPHNKAAVYQLRNTEKQWDNSINEPPIYYIKNQLDATLAILFISNCKITIHVSDAFCVHHQEY